MENKLEGNGLLGEDLVPNEKEELSLGTASPGEEKELSILLPPELHRAKEPTFGGNTNFGEI